MRTLGAVLAGGRSSRFGTDKAEALLDGRSLLAHAVVTAASICDGAVVVGRTTAIAPCVEDWPRAGRGPLGGLAGALRYASASGFDRVFSIPVDCVALPSDLLAILDPAPAFLAAQPVISLWPVLVLPALEHQLTLDRDRSMRAFGLAVEARPIEVDLSIPNINRPEDLTRLVARPAAPA